MAARIFYAVLAIVWILGAAIIAAHWWVDRPLGGGWTFATVVACLCVAIDIYRERL